MVRNVLNPPKICKHLPCVTNQKKIRILMGENDADEVIFTKLAITQFNQKEMPP